MSNAPPSPPPQDSSELPMDPDRYIESAQEIFREARLDEANVQKFFLLFLSPRAPRNEVEACIKSSFRKLASLVAGRSDLALPGSEYYSSFYVLFVLRNQSNEYRNEEDSAIRELINYSSSSIFCIDLLPLTS